MKPNLFLYLLKQSVLKSLQGAVWGSIAIFILFLAIFLGIQGFSFAEPYVYYGIYALLVSFISFMVAIWVSFMLGTYWIKMRNGVLKEKFVLTMPVLGGIAGLLFFVMVIRPGSETILSEFFSEHAFAGFFYIVNSLLISCGTGLWIGRQLTREIVRQNETNPDLFSSYWEKTVSKVHLRIFLLGGSLALFSAIISNCIFGFVWGYLEFTSGNRINSMEDTLLSTILSLTQISLTLSSIPSVIGGYILSYLIYQNIQGGAATIKTSLVQGVMIGGLTAFWLSMFVGYFYSLYREAGSVSEVIPIVILATFLASGAGGWTGVQLFKAMQGWSYG